MTELKLDCPGAATRNFTLEEACAEADRWHALAEKIVEQRDAAYREIVRLGGSLKFEGSMWH